MLLYYPVAFFPRKYRGRKYMKFIGLAIAQTTNAKNSLKTDYVDGITAPLKILLSTVVLSTIGIVVSGHLLGNMLSLSRRGENHLTIKIPHITYMEIKGEEVFAGFAVYFLVLLGIGLICPNYAKAMFIDQLEATDSKWTAAQLLASISS